MMWSSAECNFSWSWVRQLALRWPTTSVGALALACTIAFCKWIWARLPPCKTCKTACKPPDSAPICKCRAVSGCVGWKSETQLGAGFYASGRQDSNLRHLAPKAPQNPRQHWRFRGSSAVYLHDSLHCCPISPTQADTSRHAVTVCLPSKTATKPDWLPKPTCRG